MDTRDIDRIIARYTEERKYATRQAAQEHLLAYAYMVCSTGDIEPFLRRTRAMLVFYIDSLALFDNPCRNSQACWLLFVPLLFGFSLHLVNHQGLVLPGLIFCVGTVIYGTSLLVMVVNRWFDNDILITYYQEIIALIDSQQGSGTAEAQA